MPEICITIINNCPSTIENMSKLYVTILAGGIGKRMQSDISKVLLMVKGETMIVRLVKQVFNLKPDKIIIVVGKFRNQIKIEVEKYIKDDRIVYANQDKPLGTADAVKSTLPEFYNEPIINNIILNGDVPLIQYSTIKEIYDHYLKNNSKLLITSINLSNPTGNGRIIIDSNGNFKKIVEEKDCNAKQKLLTIVNCGIYITSSDILLSCIPKIKNNNASNEYYLTDLVNIYINTINKKVDLFVLPEEKKVEIFNVNTKEQLNYLESII